MKPERIIAIVAILACSLWIGGMLTLGAVVAPIVFRTVSMPSSADAMTLIFRRFDRIILGCAALLLILEAVSMRLAKEEGRWPLVRVGATLLAAAAGGYEALVVAPGIAALHMQGALRGVGELGIEMDRLHHTAERTASLALVFLVTVVVLQVVRVSSPRRAA